MAGAHLEPTGAAGAGHDVDVEGPREQRGPRHVRGGGVEKAAADASEVSGRQDVRHRDVGPVDAACEGRRGKRIRGRDDGPGLVARRWPLPCLAPRLAWVWKPRRRRGACARRAPGQPRHDARPQLRARREDAVETRQRVARRWNQGAQPRDALNRRHDPAARDAPGRLLHPIRAGVRPAGRGSARARRADGGRTCKVSLGRDHRRR
jgi:hypothetical protein